MLSASSPEIQAFIAAYEENSNLGHFGRNQTVIAEDRRKYIAIDEVDRGATPPYHGHRGGRFLIDRERGTVHTIDGYGKKGRWTPGTVESLTRQYREATASFDPHSRVMVEHSGGVRTTPRRNDPDRFDRPQFTVLPGGLQRRNPRPRYRNR